MLRMAVDPEQHPVDQYRYDSEWSDILQYLALLYIHSKLPYYKGVGRATWFNTKMNIYRDMDVYSHDFMRFLEEVVDAKEFQILENLGGDVVDFFGVFIPEVLRDDTFWKVTRPCS